jgi:hypothetical protein
MLRQLLLQGFVQPHGDPCLYIKTYSDGTTLDLTLYVDNIFATTEADKLADADVKELNERFPGTLQENPKFFLGLNIKYVGLGRIKLSCKKYINTLEGRFPAELMDKEKRDITVPSEKLLLEAYEDALKANINKERAIILTSSGGMGPRSARSSTSSLWQDAMRPRAMPQLPHHPDGGGGGPLLSLHLLHLQHRQHL